MTVAIISVFRLRAKRIGITMQKVTKRKKKKKTDQYDLVII